MERYLHKKLSEVGEGGGGDGSGGKSPYIGENGHWFEWNAEQQQFVDTGVTAQGRDGNPGLQGPQGIQGNTGSNVAYPFELVNNRTTNDPEKALSAAEGYRIGQDISQLEAKVTDLIEGYHFNHTFDSSEFDNIIWNGTKFTASNANYNSFIFPLKEGVTYNVGGTFGNISLFAVQPVIGVEAQYIRRLGASTTSFVPASAEKWALVSIVVASFTSFSLAYDVQGIRDDINGLQDQIDDVNDRIDNLDVSTENISEDGKTQKEINAEFRDAINDTLHGEIRITDFKNKIWSGTAISDNPSFWSCELNVEKYDKIHIASDQTIDQVRFFASEPLGTPAPTSQIKQMALPADGYVDTAGYDWIMISYARNIHPTYVDVKFDSLADVVEKQGEEIASLDAKVNPDVADLSFYDKTRMYDKTNYGKPIVAFCFDRFVSNLFNLFDTKGLRATFAVDGYATSEAFKANLKNTGYWELFPKGFDMVTHGVETSIGRNVGQSGVCSEDEKSTRMQFDAIRSQFRSCGLKDDMLVYFNSTVNCPATFDIVSEYYKVGLGWENGSAIRGINPFDVDFRFVDRCWIERDVYTLDILKNMVLDNLNRPVLLLFGTHSNDVLNSGKIEPFLDFLKGLVDAGAIINVGLHEAIGIIENYRKCYNVIPQKVNIYKLRGGEVFKYNGTAYRCVTEGVPALYKITVTGTPQSGSFEISLDGGGNQRIIATTGEMSANDVAMRFYTHGTYKQYRTTVVGNVVYMQRSRTDDANASLSIINNTSGMTFTVEQVVVPVASVYTEI